MRKNTIGALVSLAAVAAVLMARESGGPLTADVPSYRVQGPAGAPVTIVAFSDFECPNCAKAEPFLKELLARHAGKVRFYFRHHPIRQHKWALAAARAAEVAGLQGKFWEYHDVLFQRQTDWIKPEADPAPLFLGYARELGLDADRFARELKEARWGGPLEADVRAGQALGVDATPTFFIAGERRVGAAQLLADGERLIVLAGG